MTFTDTWVGRKRQDYLLQLRLPKLQQTVRKPGSYGQESVTIVSNTICLGHKDTLHNHDAKPPLGTQSS